MPKCCCLASGELERTTCACAYAHFLLECMGRWRLLEGSMGIPNALPADTSVLKGANVVAYLIGNGKRLGFNTFRCIQTRQRRPMSAWFLPGSLLNHLSCLNCSPAQADIGTQGNASEHQMCRLRG